MGDAVTADPVDAGASVEPDPFTPTPHDGGVTDYRGEYDLDPALHPYDTFGDVDDVAAYMEDVVHDLDPRVGEIVHGDLPSGRHGDRWTEVRGLTTPAPRANRYRFNDGLDDPVDRLFTAYHEGLHGVMHNVRREQDALYGPRDEEAFLFLNETLVPFLSDQDSYAEGRPFAAALLDAVDDDTVDTADALEHLSKEYTVGVVQYDADGAFAPYDVVVREGDLDEDELYAELVEEGVPVDPDDSYVLEFSDQDTELYADLVDEFVDRVDDRYAALYEAGAVLPPGAVDRLSGDVPVDAVYGRDPTPRDSPDDASSDAV